MEAGGLFLNHGVILLFSGMSFRCGSGQVTVIMAMPSDDWPRSEFLSPSQARKIYYNFLDVLLLEMESVSQTIMKLYGDGVK